MEKGQNKPTWNKLTDGNKNVFVEYTNNRYGKYGSVVNTYDLSRLCGNIPFYLGERYPQLFWGHKMILNCGQRKPEIC